MARLRNVYVPFTLTNSSSIFISWELPPLAINPVGNKPTIEKFIISYRVVGELVPEAKPADPNQFNITISDLKVDTEYKVIVGVKYEVPNFYGENVTFPIIRTRPQSKLLIQRSLHDYYKLILYAITSTYGFQTFLSLTFKI